MFPSLEVTKSLRKKELLLETKAATVTANTKLCAEIKAYMEDGKMPTLLPAKEIAMALKKERGWTRRFPRI